MLCHWVMCIVDGDSGDGIAVGVVVFDVVALGGLILVGGFVVQ